MRVSAILPAVLSLASVSSAHFLMNYPDSIGFDDDKEGTAPCGGFTPDTSSGSKQLVDFHVGGDSLAMRSTHTQVNWLFRVTLDGTAQSGWKQVFPIVEQSGLGNFCEPQITLPASYAGKTGVIGVVADGPDGLLYQVCRKNSNSLKLTASNRQTTNSALLPTSSLDPLTPPRPARTPPSPPASPPTPSSRLSSPEAPLALALAAPPTAPAQHPLLLPPALRAVPLLPPPRRVLPLASSLRGPSLASAWAVP